jgi:hypothetical protein
MALAMPSVMVVDEFGFRTRMRRFRLRKRISDMMWGLGIAVQLKMGIQLYFGEVRNYFCL